MRGVHRRRTEREELDVAQLATPMMHGRDPAIKALQGALILQYALGAAGRPASSSEALLCRQPSPSIRSTAHMPVSTCHTCSAHGCTAPAVVPRRSALPRPVHLQRQTGHCGRDLTTPQRRLRCLQAQSSTDGSSAAPAAASQVAPCPLVIGLGAAGCMASMQRSDAKGTVLLVVLPLHPTALHFNRLLFSPRLVDPAGRHGGPR